MSRAMEAESKTWRIRCTVRFVGCGWDTGGDPATIIPVVGDEVCFHAYAENGRDLLTVTAAVVQRKVFIFTDRWGGPMTTVCCTIENADMEGPS